MRHLRALGLLAVLAAVAASAALAQAAPRAILQPGDMYKPHAFPVSGDGDFYVHGLHWHAWGHARAVAYGTATEQDRPSHVNHNYPVRVTLSRLTYCADHGRRVYLKVSARILGPDPGVFGSRTFGRAWTCAGTWTLTAH